jgi:hypothetical protein
MLHRDYMDISVYGLKINNKMVMRANHKTKAKKRLDLEETIDLYGRLITNDFGKIR